MLVKGYIEGKNLLIPNIDMNLISNNKLFLDIEIISRDLDNAKKMIRKTSGILKNYNIDGVEYQNKIRNEWEERLNREVNINCLNIFK
jgi:hypothetical protein